MMSLAKDLFSYNKIRIPLQKEAIAFKAFHSSLIKKAFIPLSVDAMASFVFHLPQNQLSPIEVGE